MIEITPQKFITALNEVAATDSGRIVLAALKDSCHWDATYLSSESPQVTQFYAAQRGIYGGIRQHIKREHLIPIEFNYTRKYDTGSKPAGKSRRKSTGSATPSTSPADK